jgi:hypothetical protein
VAIQTSSATLTQDLVTTATVETSSYKSDSKPSKDEMSNDWCFDGWRIYNVVGFVKGHDDLRVLGAGLRAPQAFIADP